MVVKPDQTQIFFELGGTRACMLVRLHDVEVQSQFCRRNRQAGLRFMVVNTGSRSFQNFFSQPFHTRFDG